TSRCQLSFRVVCAMATDRAHVDRRLPGAPEQLNRGIDLADVDEATRPNLIAIESFPIRSHRLAGVTAGREPRPMPGRELRLPDRLEVEGGQRTGRGGDQMAVRARRGRFC